VGADFRAEKGIDENAELIAVDDPTMFYRIAEVVAPGYVLHLANGDTAVISPARVKVYSPQGA
jgi:hypothetical protein